MKTLYGVQLGNYLRVIFTNEIIEVNGITKRKIGYLDKTGKEHYHYLNDLIKIKLTIEILEKYKDLLEYYKFTTEGFYIIPMDSGNLYTVKWFHEFQNIMYIHGHIIKWIYDV